MLGVAALSKEWDSDEAVDTETLDKDTDDDGTKAVDSVFARNFVLTSS